MPPTFSLQASHPHPQVPPSSYPAPKVPAAVLSTKFKVTGWRPSRPSTTTWCAAPSLPASVFLSGVWRNEDVPPDVVLCAQLGVATDVNDTDLKKAYRKQAIKVRCSLCSVLVLRSCLSCLLPWPPSSSEHSPFWNYLPLPRHHTVHCKSAEMGHLNVCCLWGAEL